MFSQNPLEETDMDDGDTRALNSDDETSTFVSKLYELYDDIDSDSALDTSDSDDDEPWKAKGRGRQPSGGRSVAAVSSKSARSKSQKQKQKGAQYPKLQPPVAAPQSGLVQAIPGSAYRPTIAYPPPHSNTPMVPSLNGLEPPVLSSSPLPTSSDSFQDQAQEEPPLDANRDDPPTNT